MIIDKDRGNEGAEINETVKPKSIGRGQNGKGLFEPECIHKVDILHEIQKYCPLGYTG